MNDKLNVFSCSESLGYNSLHSFIHSNTFFAFSMDFFKTVFATDLDPNPSSSAAAAGGSSSVEESHSKPGWNIGGLIKTVASKSESVIQTYRRDLEEFGSGLKKETVAIREAATKSIDEIITHGKEILAVDSGNDEGMSSGESGKKRYTRLEAQVIAIQSDERTFLTNADDLKDFERWKVGFDLEDRKEEIEMLLYDSDVLEGMAEKFVPDIVDYWTFWYRYFYRVHKAKQAEEARAQLVKRVISGEEEEELSWEVDDDEEEIEKVEGIRVEKMQKDGEKKREIDEIVKIEGIQVEIVQKDGERKREIDEIEKIEGTQVENVQNESEIKGELDQRKKIGGTDLQDVKASKDEKLGVEKDKTEEAQDMEKAKAVANKHEEKIEDKLEEKERELVPETTVGTKNFDASKSESFVGTGTNDEKVELKDETEEDLDWDEIEDLGENDETKSSSNPNPNLKDDLHKRLSVAEDDEDLSWDIEEDDDDSPKKP